MRKPRLKQRRRRRRKLLLPAAQRIAYAVPEAGALIGLGRNASYAAAKSGAFQVVEVNRRILVPKGPFHRQFGLEPAPALAKPAEPAE